MIDLKFKGNCIHSAFISFGEDIQVNSPPKLADNISAGKSSVNWQCPSTRVHKKSFRHIIELIPFWIELIELINLGGL